MLANPLIPQTKKRRGGRGREWDFAHYEGARFDLMELRCWIHNEADDDCLTAWLRDELYRLNHEAAADGNKVDFEQVSEFMAGLDDSLRAIYEKLGSINSKFEEASHPPKSQARANPNRTRIRQR